MKNNMLNKLKSDYEELELKPASELWGRLETKLEEEYEKPMKKTFQWWQYAAVILLCVSVGSLFYFNVNDNDFSGRQHNYRVGKAVHKTVYPISPEFNNPVVEDFVKSDLRHQKTSADQVSVQEVDKEVSITKSLTTKTQNITLSQDEKIMVKAPEIEVRVPVIAEAKKSKPTYINSSELLLGHEFDKASGNTNKKDIKIGILNFDKQVPDVENVTVLGVTVYVEPK
ncbi:hypothetical protein MKJ01_09715 [Chryseobacterium sp. SSA4.19]|uniref:hypothetical protein n=1 Tax=Chryseobacterium sp. SSA4.19 TaxID=2919915 RepID=UPI001F4E9456|nr:hypothetical protein [Chryseobacterium sp. SSA4.19]MCJ8154034.1 hypothetical protein [Chryseobacterium sp. SSA4.19]